MRATSALPSIYLCRCMTRGSARHRQQLTCLCCARGRRLRQATTARLQKMDTATCVEDMLQEEMLSVEILPEFIDNEHRFMVHLRLLADL